MAVAELTLSVIPSPLTRPVLDGRATVAGASVDPRQARSVNANSLEMLDLAYDVAEMSLATFTKAREQGRPIVALPLFTGRRFLQPGVTFAARAGIHDPSELRGKRVGLPQFWMTSSVWHRLVLRQMHGVAQHEVHWVTTARERMGALAMPPVVDVRMDASGRSPRDLMRDGEIDAAMAAGGGRGDGQAHGDGVVPAYPDLVSAQRDYYERTRIFPIMHLIVMKEELARSRPELIEGLCRAFLEAKALGLREAIESEQPLVGASADEARRLLGDDPWPYGLAANRDALETFVNDARDQHLLERPMAVDELFASNLPADLR
ncbi:MAG TPA: hypothetical protein VFC51_08345 [Chloroflexota bacterium]|nr:hypothetical protein [Chloroflexota bacterium]